MSSNSRTRLAQELLATVKGSADDDSFGLSGRADWTDSDSSVWEGDADQRQVPGLPRPRGYLTDGTEIAGRTQNQTKEILGNMPYQRRSNRRFTDPVLRVVVFNGIYETIDWSLGGLLLRNYVGDLRQGNRFQITFSLPAVMAYYAAEVRVICPDLRARTLSLKFEKLSQGAFDFLSGLQLQQARKRQF